MRERIDKIVAQHIDIVNDFFSIEEEKIINTVDTISERVKDGHKILLAGNGGSAADALHITAELIGRFYIERKPIPAIALPSNPSVITEIGNDYTFREVFKRQLEALGEKGDIFIAISTSGKSQNIIDTLKVAKKMGIYTICFSGATGGMMKEFCDTCFCVPTDDTPRIQEIHIILGHIICELLEQRLYGEKR